MYDETHSELFQGFTIEVTITPEIHFLDWPDESDEGIKNRQEVEDKIDSGELMHFSVKVTASVRGIELAHDYLGGCVYKTLQEFINPDCYYGDMRKNVVDTARKEIRQLSTTVKDPFTEESASC